MNITEVSVVVVNWNTKELFQNCLTLVYMQAGGVNYKILLRTMGQQTARWK
jgi:hypothetical protein